MNNPNFGGSSGSFSGVAIDAQKQSTETREAWDYLDRLEKSIACLCEVGDNLAQRLHPVLDRSNLASEGVARAVAQPKSALVERLEASLDKILGLEYQMNKLVRGLVI